MSTITHFHINTENIERAKKFYEQLFDWSFIPINGNQEYLLILTTDKEGNAGVGGGMAKTDKFQNRGIINYISTETIDESINKVKEFGGNIIQPKQVVPGWGYMALCTDTEGNHFGLFEENDQSE